MLIQLKTCGKMINLLMHIAKGSNVENVLRFVLNMNPYG